MHDRKWNVIYFLMISKSFFQGSMHVYVLFEPYHEEIFLPCVNKNSADQPLN